jgi:hypothetical protein
MAFKNPNFDPDKPYDEVIIWTPEGLDRLVSMDETDVRKDQTKRGKSAGTRSVIVNAPGSRRGHGKGKSGRKPKAASGSKPSLHRGGRAGGSAKIGGKHGLKPGQLDKPDALATKGSTKKSFAGGTLGNGRSLSPHIMADHPLTADELALAPVGTARDASGKPIPATFNINSSGGMLEGDMLKWAEEIAAPSARATPQARGIWCFDGLQQHHSFKVVQKAEELNFDIALRFPHGSSRGQHEDFEHFAYFQPAFEDAKIEMQVRQFQAARAKAAAEGREPTRAELMAAATLSDAQTLAAAKEPWEEAFSVERVKRGWAREGIVPFTRKLMWDLKDEEKKMGKKVSNVPPVDVSGFNIQPLTSPPLDPSGALVATNSTALTAPQAAAPAWDQGIDEEVERLLRAEIGDPALNVPSVPPPPKQPRLGASLLFKLPGGVTGATGKQLIRAKEVERRLSIARAQYNKTKRDAKGAQQADDDFAVAASALDEIEAGKELKKLSKGDLQSLVRALDAGNANANKPELAELLQKKFGNITEQQFQALRATVQRGLAKVAIAQPIERLALPLEPPPPDAATAPAPVTDLLPQKRLRKRRV